MSAGFFEDSETRRLSVGDLGSRAAEGNILYKTAGSIRTTSSVWRWVSVFMNIRLS